MGFYKLESLWRLDYRIRTTEPFLTQPATEEAKESIGEILGKALAKPELDAVPFVIGGCPVITGNGVKGLFRHIISAQLTAAGVDVCVQKVKLGEEEKPPEGRREACSPRNPCFVCRWFGTASRQGALYFSMLACSKPVEEALLGEPIPMIALSDEYKASVRRAFLLLAPLKSGVEFKGSITGENLTEEVIGALKEVSDMSQGGFVKLGGFKTRGMGGVEILIDRIEKYRTTPFKLEKSYEKEELERFLSECQDKYHEIMKKR
jgi:CRISPR/Cas system CSM-associated protein Csm3 (group 7 of RAMP superfamily)